MSVPTTSRVICDWGERTIFGKARNYGAIGYRSAVSGCGDDAETQHFILVSVVLARYPSRHEAEIRDHVRRVLEIEASGLDDLRGWNSEVVPVETWHNFVGAVTDAARTAYASRSVG